MNSSLVFAISKEQRTSSMNDNFIAQAMILFKVPL